MLIGIKISRNSAFLGSYRPRLLFFPLINDGWMTCDFTSFSILLQSYQDDGMLIIGKAECNGAPFTVEEISPRAGIELGPLESRPALNPLNYRGSFIEV